MDLPVQNYSPLSLDDPLRGLYPSGLALATPRYSRTPLPPKRKTYPQLFFYLYAGAVLPLFYAQPLGGPR